MKLASYLSDGRPTWGVIQDREIVHLATHRPSLPADLGTIIARWPELRESIQEALPEAPREPLEQCHFLPPITAPQKVFCVGRNYADHATEQGAEIPSEPVIFNKLPGSLVGHGGTVRIPPQAKQVDFEGELVVVIGRAGRYIAEERAAEHIFGLTCGNDITARDWQKGRPGGQWLLGKAIDTFGPLGPWIVTRDEFPEELELQVRTRVNGELMQDGNTRQFLFRVERLIAHLSNFCRLEPGDLLFTGTPQGVGIARNPPVLLQAGDRVDVEIESIGVLHSEIAVDSPSFDTQAPDSSPAP